MMRVGLVALLLSAVSVPVSATLIGDTVDVTYTRQGVPPQTTSAVVSSGYEFSTTVLTYSNLSRNEMAWVDLYLDLSDTQLTVGLAQYGTTTAQVTLQTNSNRDFLISDLDWIGLPGTITGLTYASQFTSPNGNWNVDLSQWLTGFTPDSLSLQIPGGFFLALAGTEGVLASATFDLSLDHSAPVPEPSTLCLFLVGAATLAYNRSMARRVI